MPQVIIVGAGPTGASLALALAQRHISVTLIEAAKAFDRVFRGEGLMPSGLDAIDQLGFTPLLANVPQSPFSAWEFVLDRQSLFRVAEPMGATRPCTLISQPHFLQALVTAAQAYPHFEWLPGSPVKDLLWSGDRVSGVRLANDRCLTADLVIAADGRNSIVRQKAGLNLLTQPKTIDVLWFKLPTHPRFAGENTFYSIVAQNTLFSLFQGATAEKLHLGWTVSSIATAKNSPADSIARQQNWSEVFAASSPAWLADHFRHRADSIESPLRLSVIVGRCPRWHCPGVLLLGDAAHPLSPVRVQGINLGLRDVLVALNHLVPRLQASSHSPPHPSAIDLALQQIQTEREPEIIRAQHLQQQETRKGELLRDRPLIRSLLLQGLQVAPSARQVLKQVWLNGQTELRQGITSVTLTV